jgi:hypothetical protein
MTHFIQLDIRNLRDVNTVQTSRVFVPIILQTRSLAMMLASKLPDIVIPTKSLSGVAHFYLSPRLLSGYIHQGDTSLVRHLYPGNAEILSDQASVEQILRG